MLAAVPTAFRADAPVFVAGSAVCGGGIGLTALRQVLYAEPGPAPNRSLAGFRAEMHLKQKKMTKAVSKAAALALVACEDLATTLDAGGPVRHDPFDVGIFISSPAPYATDKINYRAAVAAAAGPQGAVDLATFARGTACVQPMTGILGLPNGALCYASIILGAKGRNAAYPSSSVGGHLALLRAKQSLQMGRLSRAIAGGYAMATEQTFSAYRRAGDLAGAELADGAVFWALEYREADDHYGWLLGGAAGPQAPAAGPTAAAETLADTIGAALGNARVGLDQVDLVFAPRADRAMGELIRSALARLPGGSPAGRRARLVSASRLFGDLAEASGLLEVLLATEAATQPGRFPWLAMTIAGEPPAQAAPLPERSTGRPALILQTSHLGEQSCLVIRPNPRAL